jgi:hypothetical protein
MDGTTAGRFINLISPRFRILCQCSNLPLCPNRSLPYSRDTNPSTIIQASTLEFKSSPLLSLLMLYISGSLPCSLLGWQAIIKASTKAWRMARRTVKCHRYIDRRPKPRARWNSAITVSPRPSPTLLEIERTLDSRAARPAWKACITAVACQWWRLHQGMRL